LAKALLLLGLEGHPAVQDDVEAAVYGQLRVVGSVESRVLKEFLDECAAFELREDWMKRDNAVEDAR
jgi:hypothetical protein